MATIPVRRGRRSAIAAVPLYAAIGWQQNRPPRLVGIFLTRREYDKRAAASPLEQAAAPLPWERAPPSPPGRGYLLLWSQSDLIKQRQIDQIAHPVIANI